MSASSETFEQWRERRAPPPTTPWSRHWRLTVAALIGGIVTPLGALSADDPLAGGLFVVYFAAAVALADRDVSPWA